MLMGHDSQWDDHVLSLVLHFTEKCGEISGETNEASSSRKSSSTNKIRRCRCRWVVGCHLLGIALCCELSLFLFLFLFMVP